MGHPVPLKPPCLPHEDISDHGGGSSTKCQEAQACQVSRKQCRDQACQLVREQEAQAPLPFREHWEAQMWTSFREWHGAHDGDQRDSSMGQHSENNQKSSHIYHSENSLETNCVYHQENCKGSKQGLHSGYSVRQDMQNIQRGAWCTSRTTVQSTAGG